VAETVSRTEMETKPYTPIAGAINEYQDTHSLQYIAFYLGEIEKHLGQITKTLGASGANGAQIALALQNINRVLAMKK
jgi:hypothetical protein